ncbi:MAG: trypsin-like serine protease [Rhodospirillaceae bacterium]|nr:trypsin-like serine protease [Rhodospirillaceae bacterium]
MARASILLLLAIMGATLAGCAERVVSPPPPISAPQQIPWTAAVGKLVIAHSARPCTAVLVAPDLIVTAAHCLHQNSIAAQAGDLTFLPNYGAEPDLGEFQGVSIRAMGGAIKDVNKGSDIVRDWALIGIAPPLRAVRPLVARPLDTDAVIARIAAGEKLYTAGYGNGVAEILRPHSPCKVVKESSLNPLYAVDMVVTTCIIRIGDSGGPIVLVNQAGQPTLFGIFAGFGQQRALGTSYGVNVSSFADELPVPLLSRAAPSAESPLFWAALGAN